MNSTDGPRRGAVVTDTGAQSQCRSARRRRPLFTGELLDKRGDVGNEATASIHRKSPSFEEQEHPLSRNGHQGHRPHRPARPRR
jgi:F-type H+-transporting ATPase subunit beta